MAWVGGVSGGGGAVTAPGGGRRELPRAMRVARVLIHVLFGATVVGGLGLFGSALAADALEAGLLGVLLYGAAPGVAAWVLSRRAWTGGVGLWFGLVATQVWLVLGALANVGDGYMHGFTELFLPLLVLWFLTRPESREWFRLPEQGARGEAAVLAAAHAHLAA